MSKQTKKVQEELDMEMTPMIDCVFLLMIFFVLGIDLSQQDLEIVIIRWQYNQVDSSFSGFIPFKNGFAIDG